MAHKNTNTQETTIRDCTGARPLIVDQSLTAICSSKVDLNGIAAVAYHKHHSVCFRPPPSWHSLAITLLTGGAMREAYGNRHLNFEQMTKVVFDTRLTRATAELHDSTQITIDHSAYTVNRIAGQLLDIAFVVRNSITKARAEKSRTEGACQLCEREY